MFNHLIDTANARFSHLAGENVVIYGMGQFASDLADNRGKLVFRIVGVMDRDATDGVFKGIPVVNTQNVCDTARVVIIAALGSSCPIIYDRISFLKDKGVDIYFPDGEKRSARVETRASEYFIATRKQLALMIDVHDVISFDVFDTLLMRKCLFSREVFNILEGRHGIPGFAAKRAGAENTTENALGRLPTIFEIYEHMGRQNILPADEIALEKELLSVRLDMVVYFEYALANGKTVILTSDMYLPEIIMREILTKCGITGYEKIYVSCDLNSRKSDGCIWERIIREYESRKILHIGDNVLSDHVSNSGISSFIIKGTVEIADILGFGKALAAAGDYRDCLTIGTVLAKLLALDLTNVDGSGILIENTEDIGYCFIAPQTFGFVTWLARTAAANGEKRLYFCARDAYMFMRLYEKISSQYDAPPAQYLYISKRVLCGVLADNPSNIRKCLEYYYARFSPKTTVKDAIYRLFGVDVPTDDFTSLSVKDTDAEMLFSRINGIYFPLFRENAEKEKRNFFKYLKEHKIDLKSAALVDYMCGKSLRLAEELFDAAFYLFGLTDPSLTINKPDSNINTWLEKPDDLYLPLHDIMKHSQFGEAVYSSPEGTCLAFDEQGIPILDDGQTGFSVIDAIYEGVEAFCGDVGCTANSETADKIFGALFSGNFSFGNVVGKMTWSSYTANKGVILA